MTEKIVVIFGAAGQDGSLACKYHLKRDYKIYALSQTNTFLNLKSIKNKKLIKKKIDYYDFDAVKRFIKKSNCKKIYFFGGRSSPQYSFKNFNETLESHILPVFNILQTILEINKKIKFFNACSPEIFAKAKKKLTENSPKDPQNPYGLAKLDSYLMVKFFRENFKMHCFSGILFNHESKLRPNNFLIPKIFYYIKNRKRKSKLVLGDLSAIKDFGWAEEYIEIIYNLMRKDFNNDIIIATGKSYRLSKVVDLIFKKYQLNRKQHVRFSKNLYRPSENKIMKANIFELEKLGFVPKVYLSKIIDMLYKNDSFK